jgi:hypothetical protein
LALALPPERNLQARLKVSIVIYQSPRPWPAVRDDYC